jgi:hypothetical protein
MRGRTVLAAALLLAIAAPALGCGSYHFVRASQSLGPVRRVAVTMLANDSYQPGVELMVTEALRREIQRRGATLVQDPAQADLVIEGTVRELGLSSRSFSSIAFTLEYQIDLKLDLTARRADGSRVEIDRSALEESELYLTSSDIEAEFKNRDEALRRLSAQLAARVHDSLANRLALQ